MTAETETLFPTEEETGGEEQSPKPRASKEGEYYCRYCPAGPFKTTSRRSKHERGSHADEKELTKSAGGLEVSGLSERTKEFAEVLSAVVTDIRAATKKQVILAFEQEADMLVRDRRELEDFLDDQGFTLHQIRQIARRIIGRGNRGTDLGSGAHQQAMAYDPRTGQSVPVIVSTQESVGDNMHLRPLH